MLDEKQQAEERTCAYAHIAVERRSGCLPWWSLTRDANLYDGFEMVSSLRLFVSSHAFGIRGVRTN